MDQRQSLINAEEQLKVGPVAMAGKMGVSYDTYKNWKSEARKMPPVAIRCLELVLLTRGD